MKIVMTGGSGFLGGWIANLLGFNYQVVLLGRPNSDFWRVCSNQNIEIITAEVSDWSAVINVNKPDCLILNDWQGVENQYRNDKNQFDNVARIKTLLEELKPVSKIIGVGSQAELGPCFGSIFESQGDNPTTLYGEAKVKARETLLEARKNQSKHYWARIFSTYGNMDNGTWLLPSLISSLGAGKEFQMTSGDQVWSYLHALDLAFAFQTIIENDIKSSVINVGNPNTVTIKDIALQVGDKMAATELIQMGAIPYRVDQVMELRPVCESLTSVGWKPKVRIEDGIDSLISEYKTKEFNVISFIQNYL